MPGEDVPDQYILLEKEMETKVPLLRSRFPRLMASIASHQPDKMDNDGSITDLIYQHLELRCMLAAKAAAEAQLMEGEQAELVVGATIHDGFLRQRLPGAEPGAPLPAHLLCSYEQAILEATGLRVRLAEKPWASDPSFIEPANTVQESEDGELVASCDYDAALLLRERLKGQMLWCGNELYWKSEAGLWSGEPARGTGTASGRALMSLVMASRLKKKVEVGERIKLVSYAESVSGGLMAQLVVRPNPVKPPGHQLITTLQPLHSLLCLPHWCAPVNGGTSKTAGKQACTREACRLQGWTMQAKSHGASHFVEL